MSAIAHVCHPYLPRSETFVYERVRRIGAPSLVFTDEAPRHTELFPHDHLFSLASLPLPLRKANILAQRLTGSYPAYRRWLKEQRAAAIIAHHGPVAAFCTPLAKAAGLPLAACFYGIDASAFLKDPKWLAAYKPMFQAASLVVALSQDMMSRLAAAGCPEHKLFENHLARDVSLYEPTPRPDHGGPLRLLSIGRLVPKKGFDDVIAVLGDLKQRGVPFLFTLVGEGPQIVSLEKQWFDLKLNKEVNWVGALDSAGVRRWLQWADVVLAPSKRAPDGDEEGTPTVLVEAGLMAAAILATRHAGIPNMLQHGEEALLVPEADRPAMLGALTQLAADPALRLRLGQAARARMLRDYNADTEAQKLLERLKAL